MMLEASILLGTILDTFSQLVSPLIPRHIAWLALDVVPLVAAVVTGGATLALPLLFTGARMAGRAVFRRMSHHALRFAVHRGKAALASAVTYVFVALHPLPTGGGAAVGADQSEEGGETATNEGVDQLRVCYMVVEEPGPGQPRFYMSIDSLALRPSSAVELTDALRATLRSRLEAQREVRTIVIVNPAATSSDDVADEWISQAFEVVARDELLRTVFVPDVDEAWSARTLIAPNSCSGEAAAQEDSP